MDETKEPPVSRELIAWLERAFPDKCPTEQMTDRQVWIAAGSAKVVRRLKQIYDTNSST
jgi:hypothetical protein